MARVSSSSSGLSSSYTPTLTPEVQDAMLAYCASQRACPQYVDGWRTVLEDDAFQNHELRLASGPRVKHTPGAYILSHWTTSPELGGALIKPGGSFVFCVADQAVVSRHTFNKGKRKAAEVDVKVDSNGPAGASSASPASAPEEAATVANFVSTMQKLVKLRNIGAVTDDEFAVVKAKAMSENGM